jgi:hypothetical protein
MSSQDLYKNIMIFGGFESLFKNFDTAPSKTSRAQCSILSSSQVSNLCLNNYRYGQLLLIQLHPPVGKFCTTCASHHNRNLATSPRASHCWWLSHWRFAVESAKKCSQQMQHTPKRHRGSLAIWELDDRRRSFSWKRVQLSFFWRRMNLRSKWTRAP